MASAVAGDHKREQALEHASDAYGMEDYGFFLTAPRIRLALHRLDGLAALQDRQRLEVGTAPPPAWDIHRAFRLTPLPRFEAMNLGWHAQQTRLLLEAHLF